MKRLFTALVILTMTALSASAASSKDNILNAIQIDSLKDTYNITLSTSAETEVKRTIQSSDNMILTLKDIKPAKSMNTIYKNAAEVDSIMVEQVGDNNLNIIVKAHNISNSAVVVDAENAETVSDRAVIMPKKHTKKAKKESIVLAAPVNSYTPVYRDEENFDDIDNENIITSGLIAKIKNILSQGNNSNIVTTGLIGLILFCGIKLFKKEEPQTVIGLAQSLKEREMNLYNSFSSYRAEENKPQMTNHPYSAPSVNINASYGLNAYKASSKNPYMSADNTMLSRKPLQQQSSSVLSKPAEIKSKPRMMTTAGSRLGNATTPQSLGLNRPVQNLSNTAKTASNIDSMKFLESMTKIYEKNGRSDLAQGLKAGMLKAKTTV